MNKTILALALLSLLGACEGLYDDEGIPRIRTQADAEAYNATVSAESDKLVCTREFVLGSNIRQFVCMTVAQRERLREQAVEDSEFLTRTLNPTGGTSAN